MRHVWIAMCTLLGANLAAAAVTTKVIEYDANGTKCKGILAWDDSVKEKRPGVLVFHEWWGLNEYAKKRAEMLAKQGYVAFCADMYGDGKTTEHPADAKKFATTVRENQKVWLGRAQAALKTFQAQPEVDTSKIAAIGYCFGGSTALTLALSGADLKAVATFHAGLPAPTAEQAKSIKAKVLICHGGADSFIPEDVIKKFRTALDEAKTSYEFVTYPGVVHSFTVESADAKNLAGMKYDADADKKSWDSLTVLLKETLK